MARSEKPSSPQFLQYQEKILKHPNYEGLEYGGSWVKAGNSSVGQKRQKWIDHKILEFSMTPGSGASSKLMYEIHPFKVKPCQICGKEMSLDYVYPNKIFIKKLIKSFPNFSEKELSIISIHDIFKMIDQNENEKFKSVIKSSLRGKDNEGLDTETLIQCLIDESKNSKVLGPGTMANPPDRFDGFHTYNRCCRAIEDTGRSAENLKSYTKDRRAYEEWSDGNHRAADQLMGNPIFLNTGLSADHLGPISLGFVHDPRFMKAMKSEENSSKRDRLILSDVITMMNIEHREKIRASSWFSNTIWQSIKKDVTDKKIISDQHLIKYQILLKKNKDLFFNILGTILSCVNGQEFLFWYLEQRYKSEDNYLYDYVLDTDTSSETFGQIKSKKLRNVTARSAGEEDRVKRIGLEAINDYISKENRKIREVLNEVESEKLEIILFKLTQKTSFSYENILIDLKSLIEIIQKRLLEYSLSL